MDRARRLAIACAVAGISAFATLPFTKASTPLGHLADDATWGLLLATVILSLLALDVAQQRRDVRALLVVGCAAAGVRAVLLVVLP